MSEAQKKKEKDQVNLRFFINYHYFVIIFFILTGMHIEGGKKETKTKFLFFFFLKMAKIQVGGIWKPRNKKTKKALPAGKFVHSIILSLTSDEFPLKCL